MEVHPTAIIADGAEIGAGTAIGPYCVIGPQVRLGERCRLHSHVVIEGDTQLGRECEVWPNAVLGTIAQYKEIDPGLQLGKLRIGDRNRIREAVTIHAGTIPGGGYTRLGNDNLLLATVHIGHDTTLGDKIVMSNGAMMAGHTVIQSQAVIGAMVGLHQFCRVGRLAMLGGGSMTPRDVPPFAMVQGDRAKIRGVNVIGMRRDGITQEEVSVVKRAYRMLFWRSTIMKDRHERARAEFGDHPLVREVLDFMSGTRRGVLMARGRLDLDDDRD